MPRRQKGKVRRHKNPILGKIITRALASDNGKGINTNNSTSISRGGGTAMTNNTTVGTMNVGGMTLNIGSNEERTQKRETENIPEPPPKRQRVKVVNPDYTDSYAIGDGTEARLLAICELSKKDIPELPSPIRNTALAVLFEEAQQLVSDKYLSPFNLNNRLEASAIFPSSSIPDYNNLVLAQCCIQLTMAL
ncbi:hypothetical protein INT45_008530 [Circinella minor]|uniref:Uncharacterized protein n=1 Tax=Circinella minor TaxID=1195481 RepID=A0A8H7VLP0_9FUNG|nr:hypothetical protein INT45_008530 [Circinella minor]